MSKLFAVVLRLQKPEISARCYGKDCGKGILAVTTDDDLGALVLCEQDMCPFLKKQTDAPLWKDGSGNDVYLRRLTTIPPVQNSARITRTATDAPPTTEE